MNLYSPSEAALMADWDDDSEFSCHAVGRDAVARPAVIHGISSHRGVLCPGCGGVLAVDPAILIGEVVPVPSHVDLRSI
jgi:hypothetical protein